LKSYFVVIKECYSGGIPAARGVTAIRWPRFLLLKPGRDSLSVGWVTFSCATLC